MKIKKSLIIIIIIFLISITFGTYAYHYIEGWNLLDSFYFVIITTTTIGYGDFTPLTSAGKLFTVFYSFIGVSIAFFMFSIINNKIFKKHVSEKVSEIKRDVKKQEELKDQIQKAIRKEFQRNSEFSKKSVKKKTNKKK